MLCNISTKLGGDDGSPEMEKFKPDIDAEWPKASETSVVEKFIVALVAE